MDVLLCAYEGSWGFTDIGHELTPVPSELEHPLN